MIGQEISVGTRFISRRSEQSYVVVNFRAQLSVSTGEAVVMVAYSPLVEGLVVENLVWWEQLDREFIRNAEVLS